MTWYETRARILNVIREAGSISQYKLVKKAGVAPNSVFKYVKMLNAEGLIRLEHEPCSRSLTGVKSIWVITPRGMVNSCPLCGHPIEAANPEGGWIG
ncbi:MAG: winged helix-turn-helix transcriptional regulator [Candidatus Bathyarchaeota archaeon]